MQDIFGKNLNMYDFVFYTKNDKPHIAQIYGIEEDHIIAVTAVCEMDYINDEIKPTWRIQKHGQTQKIYNISGVRFMLLFSVPSKVTTLFYFYGDL